MTISLSVYYRTPSLNETKRQHWAVQFKEKRRAFVALLSALQDTASGRSILTTSPEASRICSTASGTLALYLGTNRGASGSKRSKSKSSPSKTKEPKSK